MKAMRLTANNIRFVKELTTNGITWGWHIAMKDYQLSSARYYTNTDKNGMNMHTEYPKELLPKSVQKFLENSQRELYQTIENKKYGQYVEYIYQ